MRTAAVKKQRKDHIEDKKSGAAGDETTAPSFITY